jgi:prevent-host-death family protein
MDEIGVRELKQHLSEHLERVARGASVVVTDRGRPKAMIVPIGDAADRLRDGIEEGWIRPPQRTGGLDAAARTRARSRVADVLDDDRSVDERS